MLIRLISLIKKEFITIWEDKRTRAIIMVMPFMMFFVFSAAITMEVRNIDMAVLDNSNSFESKSLIEKFDNSPYFRKIYYVNGFEELKEKIDTQKVLIGVYINNDFSKNIKANKPVSVEIVTDGRQTNSASIAGSYATQIINGYNTELTKSVSPVNISVRNWFNVNLEYRWYVLTVIVALLALVVTLLLTALSVARERELGTFDQLIITPLSSFEILLGKTIPPFILALTVTSVMSFLAVIVFKIPFAGNPFYLFGAIAVSLLSIVGVGLSISSIAKTQQQAILGIITFQMPAVLLSGFVSPVEDMPQFLQILTYANPLRFFIKITRCIFLKGMILEDIIMNLIPLIIIACITLSFAAWMFKKRLD